METLPSIAAPIQDEGESDQAQPGSNITHISTKLINLHDSNTILDGLTLSSWQPDMGYLEGIDDDNDAALDPEFPQVLAISNKMSCSLCGCNFENREQQTEHYKLDWHRFNLKQRIMGSKPVTMETFEDMSGDISSLSGSESSCHSDSDDTEEPNSAVKTTAVDQAKGKKDDLTANKGRAYPRVFFRNSEGKLISVHRCILHGKKNVPDTQSQLIAMATRLSIKPKWAIIMTGGGHFAAAVFHGSEMVAHKTFHRYTVRAKRGTAQGMRDGQQGGKQPKSAGASIRRYNEAALTQDIQDLLESWKDNLINCQRIFLRAPSYNRGAFFGGKAPPFTKDDARICSIPFPTRRATLKELNRIHGVLSSIQCYGDAEEAEVRLKKIFTNRKETATRKPKKPVVVATPTEDRTENPVLIKDEESTDEEDNIENILVYEDVEISTQHLKEFDSDCSKKKPRRRKKKVANSESQNDMQDDFGGNKMTNELYTVCKSGNIDKLRVLLNEITNSAYSDNNDMLSNKQDISDLISLSNIGHELENISIDKVNDRNSTDDVIIAEHTHREQNMTDSPCMETVSKEERTRNTNMEVKSGPICSRNELSDHPSSVAETESNPGTSITSEVNANPECQSSVAETGSNAGPSLTSVLNSAIDKKGSTLLHIAAASGHLPVLWLLMESGANPSLKNKKKQPPYLLSANKEIRNEFRRFMASNPDRYNYAAAQIPGPLTSNMEEDRAKRAADKKKAQRKIKRTKEKEQYEEKKKKAAEEKEKVRFAALSDREKRALAAESRLAKQRTQTDVTSSGPRCWLCGETLAGKVPFEYLDWKFCSIKCVRQHKQQQQQ